MLCNSVHFVHREVEALPKEWRCHMLASLYIVRSDENPGINSASIACLPTSLTCDRGATTSVSLFRRLECAPQECHGQAGMPAGLEGRCAKSTENSERVAAYFDDTPDRASVGLRCAREAKRKNTQLVLCAVFVLARICSQNHSRLCRGRSVRMAQWHSGQPCLYKS